MSEVVLSSTEVLADTLSTLTIPAHALMFLERVPSVYLSDAEVQKGIMLTQYDAATDITGWERGRIFCPDWELRWDQQNMLYTGIPLSIDNFKQTLDLRLYTKHEASYYLWGQREAPNRFIELQIPRVLHYPVEATEKGRVKLRAAEWFDAAGNLVASRMTGLEADA